MDFFVLLKKYMNSQLILTVLIFTKIHFEKSESKNAARILLFERGGKFVSYVCDGFNEKHIALSFAYMYLSQSACPIVRPNSICPLLTKNACSPRLVNNSFKTYSTSPAPLLVRN